MSETKEDNAGFGMVPRHLRRRLTAFEIAVYVALSWRTDENGSCFPSHATIAADAGCSERQARRALDRLVEMGLVWRQPRAKDNGGQTSNIYRISVHGRPTGPTPSVSQARGGGLTDQGGWSDRPTNENQRNETQEKKNYPPASQSPQRGDEADEDGDEISDLMASIHGIEQAIEEAHDHADYLALVIQKENLEGELQDAMTTTSIAAEPPVELPPLNKSGVAA